MKKISTEKLIAGAAFFILTLTGATLLIQGQSVTEDKKGNESGVVAEDTGVYTDDGNGLIAQQMNRNLLGSGTGTGVLDFNLLSSSLHIELMAAGQVAAGRFAITLEEPEEEEPEMDEADVEEESFEEEEAETETEAEAEEEPVTEAEPETEAETTAAVEVEPETEAETTAAVQKPTGSIYYGKTYSLSESDILLMAAIIQLEVGNQSTECQIAVANTVLNRLDMGYWGNTVEGVIRAPGQFSPVASGSFDRVLAEGPWPGMIEIARRAAEGQRVIPETYVGFSFPDSGLYGDDHMQFGEVVFFPW